MELSTCADIIIDHHAGVFCSVLHGNHQHRQEVNLSIRVHPVFVSREDLHVVFEPFHFDKRLVCFTFKGCHCVLLLGGEFFQFLYEVDDLLCYKSNTTPLLKKVTGINQVLSNCHHTLHQQEGVT